MTIKKYLKNAFQIKIAICLFIILIIASIFGTITTVDVYHSWWFITILWLMSANIVLCCLSRKKRFVYYLLHSSILLILLGAIIGSTTGFKEYLEISQGQIVDVLHSGFQVKLEEFNIEYYPNSQMPKDYKSTLTIIEKGKDILTKTIEVNHPLSYKGVWFYQSSYGTDYHGMDYSGIKVVKDPGVFVVFLGFVLLILGLILSFRRKQNE